MTIKKFDTTSDRGFDPSVTSAARENFRGRSMKGIAAFGWFTEGHGQRQLRHRVIDHRTFVRPRRP